MIQPAAPNKAIIALLALIKFLIPFLLIHPDFELQRDEFLYYQQGQHFDLGYLENPPLLSWLGYISSLLGGAEWTIRLWPAIIGSLTVAVTCLIAARLGGKAFAQLLAGLGIIAGAFFRIHILYQPNILDIFFWTCSMYFLVRYVQTESKKDFLWVAICLALGWWSKYSVLFLILAVILGLLLTKHRKVFLQKHTYITLLISFIIILPNLWWQYAHNFPLIHHMEELRETQLVHINKIDFIKEQFLLLLPVLIIWIGGLIWFFTNSAYRIFGWIYVFVIALLLFGSGKGYYTLGIYPVLIAAGAVAWEKMLKKRIWIGYAIAVLIIFFNWLIMPALLPIWKPEKLEAFYKKADLEHKWEDLKTHPLPQDFADMMGWKELTFKTEKFYNTLTAPAQEQTIIFGRHYGHAGSLKFYGESDAFKNRVYTDVGSFLLWIPDDLNFKNLILLARRMPGADDEVFNHFQKVTVIDSVTNKFSRQYGDKIIFFENIDSAGLRLAREGLNEMKNMFRR